MTAADQTFDLEAAIIGATMSGRDAINVVNLDLVKAARFQTGIAPSVDALLALMLASVDHSARGLLKILEREGATDEQAAVVKKAFVDSAADAMKTFQRGPQ